MADKVEIVKQYMKARMAEDHATLLSLVSDDVVVESSRDGKHEGKDAYTAYLKKIKPTGTWEDPVADGDQVLVKGKVTVMFIPWSVGSHFTFNSDGKISHINTAKL
eukprot:TRINITY_DN643_c0_g1_i1.p1 TRINITY_DN643_c0_g1~~TRINITY_DN643_c0_g1_i1.p1  ORF type:complete len:121 (-),score=28.33 TRINITY_DN643_c0_g1_i1:44-361(-)